MAGHNISIPPNYSKNIFSGQNISCFRGGRVVFSDLNFSLRTGEALTLIGPNGSGKSTLLRLMAGLLNLPSGAISWNNENIAEDPERHNARLHYIGHLDAVKPTMTAFENLTFWSGLRKGSSAGIEHALDILGITHLKNVHGRFLSAGQKRRVNLARILASDATLWLLDEPTTALDARSTEKLLSAITHHREQGGMVILSTHHDLGLSSNKQLDLSHFQNDHDLSWFADQDYLNQPRSVS